jgi:hypothetical protein
VIKLRGVVDRSEKTRQIIEEGVVAHLEDQVATRFLWTFLDMSASLNGKKYHVELLNDPALWNGALIEPKTPPDPRKNDKEFLTDFPYLAEPW